MTDPVRIAVLLPSRGRPQGMAASVTNMVSKASGRHDVKYVIGCDADDQETIAMALTLWKNGLPVVPSVAARQPSLGGLTNMLALRCPADVYSCMGDDIEVLTNGWDRAIADAWTAKPDGVWWWTSKRDDTLPIVSEKWRAAAGRILTDYFPFWWDDIWLVEVLRYAHGRIGADRVDAWIKDGARSTHRMRDLAFWSDFFWSRRDERKAEARKIAERLGWPRVENLEGIDIGLNPEFDPEDIEAKQGERSPPTPEYLIAFERAKALMQKEAA